ncbi:MAG: GNAT family N-acetyltransferase [Pseudomonadota bacterium]
MQITTLDTIDEVRALEPWLSAYIHFVTADLERFAGVTFDPSALLRNTLNSLDKVVPPQGATLVAEAPDGRRLGMVFLRPSGAEAMEIKRLYVPETGRGQGVGKALVLHAMDVAREKGAARLRLDSSKNLINAINLYRNLGFRDCPPYAESDHFDDPVLGPHLVFMDCLL